MALLLSAIIQTSSSSELTWLSPADGATLVWISDHGTQDIFLTFCGLSEFRALEQQFLTHLLPMHRLSLCPPINHLTSQYLSSSSVK